MKVDAILPIATEDYPTRARRPRNSRLALDRLERLFGIIMPDWKQALDAELEEMTR